MITIIDYGLGNLTSVANAFRALAVPVVVSRRPGEIQKAKALVLPGVGAAGEGIKNLKKLGLDKPLIQQAQRGKPILGICLGMQLMFSSSEEGGVSCLDLIKGNVKKFKTNLKVPQIGWNQVRDLNNSRLLKGIKPNQYFYFVNSYYPISEDNKIIKGVTGYGLEFCSLFEKDNLFGVQFHPEKSGRVGLGLLKNFAKLIC